MLVDVICLRFNGVKLDADELAAAKPVQGHLRFWHGDAWLTSYPDCPPYIGDVLPHLEDCPVYRIDRRGIVLHGQERPRLDRFRYGEPQPQAWWAKVVTA